MVKVKKHVCVAKISKVKEDDTESFLVRFPDLPGCLAGGETISDALERAEDACALWMLHYDNVPPPDLGLLESNRNDKDNFYNLIFVDLEEYSKKISLKSVKKNVTIPSWLNEKAERENLNFSQILQQGVKDALGV